MNREQIQAILPVRDPYLWLDEVVEISESRIHARKHLDPNLEIFRAHYVDFPLFPGALQCEAAFQAAALLIAQKQTRKPGHVPVIVRVKNTKFKRMVRPGDTLDVHVELINRDARLISLKGKLAVNGQTTTQLEFSATEVDVSAPPPSTGDGAA